MSTIVARLWARTEALGPFNPAILLLAWVICKSLDETNGGLASSTLGVDLMMRFVAVLLVDKFRRHKLAGITIYQ